MTSEDATGSVPLAHVLKDIRTQLAAIVVVLQAAGFYVETPAERERLRVLAVTQQEVVDLQQDHARIRARIDSIAAHAQAVRAIVQVQCLRERERLARQILQCERYP